MDSDSFYPAFVVAAKIIGLGEVVVKKIETAGIILGEKSFAEIANSVSWRNAAKEIKERISGLETAGGTVHQIVLEALGKAGTGETAVLTVRSTDNLGLNPAFIGVRLEGEPGGITRILESGDLSNFMRVGSSAAAAGRHRMWFGGLVTVAPLETKAIKHFLGQTPTSIGITPAGNTNVNYSVEAWNETEFTLKNQHASFGAAFFWQVFA